MADVAEALGREDRSVVSTLLLRYFRWGLVGRKRSSRREYIYHITEKGKDRLDFLLAGQ